MKHAGQETLDGLEDLLAALRGIEGLVERKRGTFYRKGSAFLHFHEDPAGPFADAKLDGRDFARVRVRTARERAALVRAVRGVLDAATPAAARVARSRGTRRGA